MDYHIFVFGQHTFPYFVNKTNCSGLEAHLLDCPDVKEAVLCGSVTVARHTVQVSIIINSRRACAARVMVLVCVFVCLAL